MKYRKLARTSLEAFIYTRLAASEFIMLPEKELLIHFLQFLIVIRSSACYYIH